MADEKETRNCKIYWRYMAGDRIADLAREYGISRERATQIVRRQWRRRRDAARYQERRFLYALGLGMIYLEQRARERGVVRTYRVKSGDSMHVQDWS